MAMIGNQLGANFQTPPSVVRFDGDGSDTTFALGRTVYLYKTYLYQLMVLCKIALLILFLMGQTLTFSAAPSTAGYK